MDRIRLARLSALAEGGRADARADRRTDPRHQRRSVQGLGRPEPLQHALQGWSSRRIFGEHRLVYRVSGKGREQRLEIAQCRYCY
jgi:Txe/YoeB family toxin of toxin-antitoxin system